MWTALTRIFTCTVCWCIMGWAQVYPPSSGILGMFLLPYTLHSFIYIALLSRVLVACLSVHRLVNKLHRSFDYERGSVNTSLIRHNRDVIPMSMLEPKVWCISLACSAPIQWIRSTDYVPTTLVQVIHQKPKKSLDEITHDLCPVHYLDNLILFFCVLTFVYIVHLSCNRVKKLNWCLGYWELQIDSYAGIKCTAAISYQYYVLGW